MARPWWRRDDEIFFVAARDHIQRMMNEITRAEGRCAG